MSVLSYLTNLSSQLVLSTDERINISVSLGFLKTRLNNWSHSGDILEQEVFGSYDRDTILPRKYDEGSDVDYMIVFKNPNNYQPETFRGWLKKFAEDKYTRSEIYLDYPTTVLELSHIKFELVPAVKPMWGGDIYDSGQYHHLLQMAVHESLYVEEYNYRGQQD